MNGRERIWQVVHRIPRGKVATYGQVARLAGLPGCARYVGHTMKALPADTSLPWFRVVNARGAISFGKGTRQHLRQKALLESEGVVFVRDRFSLRRFGWLHGEEDAPGEGP